MALQSALSSFKKAVERVYANNANTPEACATGISDAVYNWAIQGIPMTKHTPALSGTGGIDSAKPGTGLAAAKSAFVRQLAASFKSRANSPSDAAKAFTDAHLAFFSKAQIKTIVTATVGSPGTPYTGTGKGGIDKPTPGKSLTLAKSSFKRELVAIYADNTATNSAEAFATKQATASMNFLSQALIDTKDSGVSGSGGQSTSGKIS